MTRERKLRSLKVQLDSELHFHGTTIRVVLSRLGEEDLHLSQIIPDDDFGCAWDYVWDSCKRLLDAALEEESDKLAEESKNEFQDK